MTGITTCEHHLWKAGRTVNCGQIVGLRRWWDSAGMKHVACPRHIAGLKHRNPEADPPEPEWLDPGYDEPIVTDSRSSWTLA